MQTETQKRKSRKRQKTANETSQIQTQSKKIKAQTRNLVETTQNYEATLAKQSAQIKDNLENLKQSVANAKTQLDALHSQDSITQGNVAQGTQSNLDASPFASQKAQHDDTTFQGNNTQQGSVATQDTTQTTQVETQNQSQHKGILCKLKTLIRKIIK